VHDAPLTLWSFASRIPTWQASPVFVNAPSPAGSGLFTPRAGRQSGLTQGLIREAALAVGMVDYKVCSVSEVWTGLLVHAKKVVATRATSRLSICAAPAPPG
jgi:hypothetical protein